MDTTVTRSEIVPASFVDAHGHVQHLDPATREAVLAVVDAAGEPPAPIVCVPGERDDELVGRLTTQDGTDLGEVDGVAPAAGYYHLTRPDGRRHLVISAPARFAQPEKGWGWAVQLYAARTESSWGIGDFRDLAAIARRAADAGAASVLISPVHAAAPVAAQQASPYSPSSRQWLQLLHIAIEDVPGADRVDLSDLAARGRALNDERRIYRDSVWKLKRAALERIWAATKDDLPADHELFVLEGGEGLRRFTLWSAIAERLNSSNWRAWPEQYRTPAGAAEFAAENAERLAFFAWAQWVADLQLGAACRAGATIVADIAVGFDSWSADAWTYQDIVDFDYEVGAPPDRHNVDGQKWGLPVLNPASLVAADFEPFIAMVQAALRHAGALRIDHVMQLWRLYWVPLGGHPKGGVYVHYPTEAMLAILRLEASRRGAWVVGEDMGTVADGVRETMAEYGMLGYRAALRLPVDQFPEDVMGASSTHDQATVAGTLTRSDKHDPRRVGQNPRFRAP